MRRLIRRIEKAVLDGYNFICNTAYYLEQGHSLGKAIDLASVTLPR